MTYGCVLNPKIYFYKIVNEIVIFFYLLKNSITI